MKSKSYFLLLFALVVSLGGYAKSGGVVHSTGLQDRQYWIQSLIKIADPVLSNLANNTLNKNMPFESLDSGSRKKFSRLEAVGRLVSGISPWLELGRDETAEGRLREKYIQLTLKGLKNAVDPKSPDYLVFGTPSQPLVDAAFLAEGLLRAKTQLWGRMDAQTKANVITELKRSRQIKPGNNNWLLFSSMVEAAILDFTDSCDMNRLTFGVNKFKEQWYVGDGMYSDGVRFHMDYYNSFVIHPMLTEVLTIMHKHGIAGAEFLPLEQARFTRYASILERAVSPYGTYPIVGRSITYRFGVFHALSLACLHHWLAKNVAPAQVRCALTAVMKRQLKYASVFDKNGWLRVGFTGPQLKMSESYINTGSEYLCSEVFLALGLPPTDAFWSDPYTEWTNLKGWNQQEIPEDISIN